VIIKRQMIPFYRVNAFTSNPFGGNPAGVCPLKTWLSDELMQKIAAENALSETAFFVPEAGGFRLRWFTPAMEVDLCGHATLASAHVLFGELGYAQPKVLFQTRSGELSAAQDGERILMDFPSRPPEACKDGDEVEQALGRVPLEVLRSRDYVAVFGSPAEVTALEPDIVKVAQLSCLGVVATAPGDGQADFVSRFFVPKAGIPEDPATGSTHCSLIPYWGARLGKTEMFARQLSKRGGEIFCRLKGGRVEIGGQATIYCRGELAVS
jgi:predicted PhzF superfamily epimerase YddE/YHI9